MTVAGADSVLCATTLFPALLTVIRGYIGEPLCLGWAAAAGDPPAGGWHAFRVWPGPCLQFHVLLLYPILPPTEGPPGMRRVLSTCHPVTDLGSDPALPATVPACHCSSSSSSHLHCSDLCVVGGWVRSPWGSGRMSGHAGCVLWALEGSGPGQCSWADAAGRLS